MPIEQYCWRCRMNVPMLDEAEWAMVAPLLSSAIQDVKDYRDRHGVSLAEAKDKALGASALAKYHALTGFSETNVNALWHHRASLYGKPCATCGKPLRTPIATFCAACGSPSNQTFNPASPPPP
jgi:hypothetical protein